MSFSKSILSSLVHDNGLFIYEDDELGIGSFYYSSIWNFLYEFLEIGIRPLVFPMVQILSDSIFMHAYEASL